MFSCRVSLTATLIYIKGEFLVVVVVVVVVVVEVVEVVEVVVVVRH